MIFVTDNIKESVFIIDQSGLIRYANEAGCRLLNYARKDLSNINIYKINPYFNKENWESHWKELKEKKSLIFESHYVKKNDVSVKVEITANYFVYNGEEFDFFLVRDSTERKLANEKLKINESLFTKIIETSLEGIQVIDANSNSIFINKRFAEMLGYTPDQVLNRPITDFMFPEDLKEHAKKINNRRNKISEIYERKFKKKDGTILWTLLSSSPLFNDKDEFEGAFAMFSDITDRKKSETEIYHFNIIYKTLSACKEALIRAKNEDKLLNDICNIIVTIGNYKMAWVGYSQYNEEKTIKKMAFAGSGIEYLNEIKLSWENNEYGNGPTGKAIRTGQVQIQNVFDETYSDIWKKNAIKYGFASSAAFPLIIDNKTFGAINIYSGTQNAFDKSELKLLIELANVIACGIMNLRIKSNQERTLIFLNAAQAAAHVGNWEFKISTNELIYSNEIIKIFEINKEIQNISTNTFFQKIHPDDKKIAQKGYHDSLISHKPIIVNYRLLLDGKTKYVQAQYETKYNENAEPVLSLGIIQDITLAKLAEEERTTHLKLEMQNKELEAFSYTVSHDLQNPLKLMASYLELLKKEENLISNEKTNSYLNRITALSNQMNQLINDILYLSKMEYQELNYTPVDLNTVIHGIVNDFQPDLKERDIQWLIANLPNISGNENLIRLVFVNLISNALKFTRNKTHTIITVDYWANSSEYVVYVKDNGVGYDMQEQSKLFGPFQRLHTNRTYEGNGIGLVNVQRIIEHHGGRVWSESEIGNGATFYVSFPLEMNKKSSKDV